MSQEGGKSTFAEATAKRRDCAESGCSSVRRGAAVDVAGPVLCRRARGAIHLRPRVPGKTVRRERCSKRWNALARTYPERSRGLDSPLGIAGALVLEGACTAGASSR